ncbi:MAG: imelysin family protein, partial [Pseudomonadota bacterium]
ALEAKAAEESAFSKAIDQLVTQVVPLAHISFLDAALGQQIAIEALCKEPSQTSLGAARTQFSELVLAWSKIELYRFGPAREDNRFEQLFYWPDRKGRGLRQVQALLNTEDPSAASAESLSQKSVAVKGLPALEFVLFGTGSENLAAGDDYRCSYATALTEVVYLNAATLQDNWSASDGFGKAMRDAGTDRSPYQSHAEAVQDFVRAASEQLQVVRDLKIGASIGETPEKAKPKRAPFWRSNLTLATMRGNLDGVSALMDGGLADLLPPEHRSLAEGLNFEIAQARAVLEELESTGEDWIDLAAEAEGHQRLSYAMIPLAGSIRIVADRMPGALGLVLGFNSLDGD